MGFVRNYILIKYVSTLRFLELQSWNRLTNIFCEQGSNTKWLCTLKEDFQKQNFTIPMENNKGE